MNEKILLIDDEEDNLRQYLISLIPSFSNTGEQEAATNDGEETNG